MTMTAENSPTTPLKKSSSWVPWLGLLLDIILVCVFAGLGRQSHELGLQLGNILYTAAPFLIALVVISVLTQFWKTSRQIWPTALIVWLFTTVGGLFLRITVFEETAATSFQIVTASVLAVFLVGRRAIESMIVRFNKR